MSNAIAALVSLARCKGVVEREFVMPTPPLASDYVYAVLEEQEL